MKHKLLLIYSWVIRTLFFFLPDVPIIMQFRGWLYGLGMPHRGKNFQVAHSATLNTIEMVSVGENVYIANFCSIIANGNITIGDNTLFGPGVVVSSGNHRFENGHFSKRSDNKNVVIGRNSWVAANCTIVGGSVLPECSILAANSVLTSKLEEPISGCLYGGTPAKLIKKL